MEKFHEKPVINSPYKIPSQHWELDASGQPTHRIIQERRKSTLVTPIPKPRKTSAKAKQGEFVHDEGKGLSTEERQYDPTPIINELHSALCNVAVACTAEPIRLGSNATNGTFVTALAKLRV